MILGVRDGETVMKTVEITKETSAITLTFGVSELPGGVGPPRDPDDDGLYEDIDGDGTVRIDDVVDLLFADFDELNMDPETREALDFDGSGRVGFGDVIALLFDL
jgi:PKD repeat protein